MLKSIKNFFASNFDSQEVEDTPKFQKVELAYAALLVEVINSDYKIDKRESKKLLEILNDKLDSNYEDLHEIIELAKLESDEATSLYEFTRLINDEYNYQEKVELIRNMWNIAFSDEELDKYEEYLIRKISDLIYVSHSDFIQSKLKAKNTSAQK